MVVSSLKITSDLVYGSGVFPAVIAAIADGRLDQKLLQTMITTRVKMEDFLEKGLKALIANKSEHLKILVEISGEE
jgi:(R,R)-butanediol dehydrogenase/meso-butanediol dehydrogenase/diacetyl reductase